MELEIFPACRADSLSRHRSKSDGAGRGSDKGSFNLETRSRWVLNLAPFLTDPFLSALFEGLKARLHTSLGCTPGTNALISLIELGARIHAIAINNPGT